MRSPPCPVLFTEMAPTDGTPWDGAPSAPAPRMSPRQGRKLSSERGAHGAGGWVPRASEFLVRSFMSRVLNGVVVAGNQGAQVSVGGRDPRTLGRESPGFLHLWGAESLPWHGCS